MELKTFYLKNKPLKQTSIYKQPHLIHKKSGEREIGKFAGHKITIFLSY